MRTKRFATGRGEELRMRGKQEGSCQVHDWPDEGLADRLMQAMRDRHPKGIDVCPPCLDRALRSAGPPLPGATYVWGPCCVCGRSELSHPDTEIAEQLGHPKPAPEHVTWRCQACNRFVCRDHVHTVPTDLPPPFHRRIPDGQTLCTDPECVQARPGLDGGT